MGRLGRVLIRLGLAGLHSRARGGRRLRRLSQDRRAQGGAEARSGRGYRKWAIPRAQRIRLRDLPLQRRQRQARHPAHAGSGPRRAAIRRDPRQPQPHARQGRGSGRLERRGDRPRDARRGFTRRPAARPHHAVQGIPWSDADGARRGHRGVPAFAPAGGDAPPGEPNALPVEPLLSVPREAGRRGALGACRWRGARAMAAPRDEVPGLPHGRP